MRRASANYATMSRPLPSARTSSLPRPARNTSRVTTTTLPKPEAHPVPEPKPSPALPTSYSTLQNYGTAEQQEQQQQQQQQQEQQQPATPQLSKATISSGGAEETLRYDSVVEEMRTFIKDKGSTK